MFGGNVQSYDFFPLALDVNSCVAANINLNNLVLVLLEDLLPVILWLLQACSTSKG